MPYTIKEYFQEVGRAHRDGLPAKAHIYFNSYDISNAKKQFSNAMRDYVTADKCKREFILNYFGFQLKPRAGPYHNYCDDCLIASVPVLFEQANQEESQPTVNVPHLHLEQLGTQLQPEVKAKLQEELHAFRLSLSGSGRTFVGSTSLSSGISIQLMEQIVENATSLTSVECHTHLSTYN